MSETESCRVFLRSLRGQATGGGRQPGPLQLSWLRPIGSVRWVFLALLAACGGKDHANGDLTTLASLAARRAPDEGEIQRIVAAVAQACGGTERIRSLTYHARADQYVTRGGDVDSNHLPATVWYHCDDRLRIHVKYHEGVEKRVLYRGEGYMAHRFEEKPTYAAGALQQYLWWDYKNSLAPKVLVDPGARLTGLEPVEVDGKLLLRLRADNGKLPVVDVSIDPNTAYVLRVEANLPLVTRAMSGQAYLHLAQEFDDFRMIDGLCLPFRKRLYTDGEVVSVLEYFELQIDPDLEESFFEP